MNAEYRGKMPLPHIIQECPAADSQVRYTAKLILPLVLAELNSYFIPILSFGDALACSSDFNRSFKRLKSPLRRMHH